MAALHDQLSNDARVVDALDAVRIRWVILAGRRWLDDLQPGPDVVGLDEATRSSTTFMGTKREMFHHLVEHRGFLYFLAGVQLEHRCA